MKAIILSGGMGTRLRPITDYVPKGLVPVDNIPIIDWQIRYFKKFGIKDFVICTGYLSKELVTHLESKNFGVKIKYSVEKTPLGTGGALKKALEDVDDDSFFVINGDIITNIDLMKLKSQSNSIAIIPLRTTYGVIHVSGNKVQGFEEKPEICDHWMNAGIYYLNIDMMKYLPNVGNMEAKTFPLLAKKGKLHIMKFNNVFWNSIDSFKDIDECVMNMKKTRYAEFLSK